MNKYRRQKRREAWQMVAYGLVVAVVGVGLMYGELTAWNSMIGFVPGIVVWPIGIGMGLAVVVLGVKELVHH